MNWLFDAVAFRSTINILILLLWPFLPPMGGLYSNIRDGLAFPLEASYGFMSLLALMLVFISVIWIKTRHYHLGGVSLNITLVLKAIAAAALFGSSAPLAKLLLGRTEPLPLAGFLYLGSGLGLLLFWIILNNKQSGIHEARITKDDLPWLGGATLAGGVAAPIALMVSLRFTPAATASLLVNFESVSTTLIAALLFKEAIGKQIWWAIVLVTAATILLTLNVAGEWGISLGVLGILGACILWGLDNNLTRKISAKDPFEVVTIKGIVAGSFTLLLAYILHNPFPKVTVACGAMLLGCLSYGLSLILFILAMRGLGAARTSAFFGTAPFIGSLLSVILFRELPDNLFFISFLVMVLGVILLSTKKHEHRHFHQTIEHDHRHRHDDGHHFHQHEEKEFPVTEYHSHMHKHESINHSHPHTPDIHHWHRHSMDIHST